MANIAPFPHEGGCPQCKAERICNFCGQPYGGARCTNGRCLPCHGKVCTGGQYPNDHGYGRSGRRHYES